MAKDKEGKFHPVKGKPVGIGKKKGVVTAPVDQEKLNQQFELEDKYAIDADVNTIEGVPVRHPNRNPDKAQDRKLTEAQKSSHKRRRLAITKNQKIAEPDKISSLSKDMLEMLAAQSGPCITIYLPVQERGLEVNEQVNQIVFKDMLLRAGTLLSSREDESTVLTILNPAYALLANETFWKNGGPGMAFFLGLDFFKYVKLPAAPEPRLWVNTAFLISPIIPFIISPEYFFLLVISKKQSKLFRADNFKMTYIPISEMPNGMDDVIHFEEKDDQKLFRTGSSGAGGGANFHGIGAGKPDEKENISMYLSEVDNTVWKEVLSRETVPLVLAGVDYLIPIYKRVTKYKNVWDAALTGSLEHENEKDLHRQARKVMQAYFQERPKKALAGYMDLSATQLTASVPEDVVRAAHFGRVDHLFVTKNARLFGTFSEETNDLEIHEDQLADDEDLLNKTILKTLLLGGQVHMVNQQQLPGDQQIAAVMRY